MTPRKIINFFHRIGAGCAMIFNIHHRPAAKEKFKVGLQFFGIHPDYNDDPYVHPPNVCDKHRRRLQAVQKMIVIGADIDIHGLQ